MDEKSWLASTDSVVMLAWLNSKTMMHHPNWDGPTDRQLRLLACACCRQVWHLLNDDRIKRAVGIAERYADGLARPAELKEANMMATAAYADSYGREYGLVMWAVRDTASKHMIKHVVNYHREISTMAALLRCIVNPFHAPPNRECPECGGSGYLRINNPGAGAMFESIPIACFTCNCTGRIPDRPAYLDNRTVQTVAASIYDDGLWGEAGVLADALEECGCPETEACGKCGGSGLWPPPTPRGNGVDWSKSRTHTDCKGTGRVPNHLLAHLRGAGPHARGCWVVDWILRKE